MSKLLSQDEINTLLENVAAGTTAPEKAPLGSKKVTVYDFRRPSLFSKEQHRLLENIHEGLGADLAVFLSAQLRAIVEMRLLAVDQLMYSEFVMSIDTPSAIYVCSFDNPKSEFILEISPELVIFVVERLFGGEGEIQKPNRPISVIEQRIMNRVVDRIIADLAKHWRPVASFSCKMERFEHNPEFVQIVPATEPVLVVSMEATVYGKSTVVNICYPYTWLLHVMPSAEVQERLLLGAREIEEEDVNLIRLNLKETTVSLRAVLGKANISIRDFLALKEGDVIRLNTEVGQLIPVFINNKLLYYAQAGRRKRKNAIKIHTLYFGE